MAVKVASWNIEGRLTRFAKKGQRGSPERIIDHIRLLDADVVFLAEASDGDNIEPDITEHIEKMGYKIVTVQYDDGDKDRQWAAEQEPNMKMLTRVKVKNSKQIRLGGLRNAVMAVIVDPETNRHLRIFGIHLDDRAESYRIRQAKDLLALLHDQSIPTIVVGDFNAMHGDDLRARLLRIKAVSILARFWPHERFRDVAIRLIGMAAGNVLSMLESDATLKDIDDRRQATTTPKMRFQEWMPSIRLVQIDHILVTSNVIATDIKVHRDGGSDHRALSAVVESS